MSAAVATDWTIKTDACGSRSNRRRYRTWTFTAAEITRYREFRNYVHIPADERAENLARFADWSDQEVAEYMARDRHVDLVGWNCTVAVTSSEPQGAAR